MSCLANEAMQAGAFGFTTSGRSGTELDGTPVPGTFAADDGSDRPSRARRRQADLRVAMAGISPGDDPSIRCDRARLIGSMAVETA
jgi:hypothetical protein